MKKWVLWILAVIIAGGLWKAGEYADYLDTLPEESEKQAITVYAPEDMEDAFKSALVLANLSETHRIVMTDEENANICVGYAKQGDKNYQKLAFTPFVVAYKSLSNTEQNRLKESAVLVECVYNDDYLEIDFLKIINEAIGEGKWANLNVKDEDKLKVFYPSEESIYWHDFYDFLLVTVNNGTYPKTEAELEKAEKLIKQFVESENTEGLTDFNEQVQRTGGFPSSVIYILPEKQALEITVAQSKYADLYYPINTVYFNYYIKGDEIGNQVINALEYYKKSGWVTYDPSHNLAKKRYRNAKYSDLKVLSEYASYERDIFNVAKIPDVVPTVPNPTVSAEATSPTSE